MSQWAPAARQAVNAGGATARPVPVLFLSDSTGISAETMGNALLIQFPQLRFERRLIPFVTTAEEARRVVAILDEAADGPVTPMAFTTAATDEIRQVRPMGAAAPVALAGEDGVARSLPWSCPEKCGGAVRDLGEVGEMGHMSTPKMSP